MTDDVELEPTESQVLQEEPDTDLVDVPVIVTGVVGPVRVQELPRRTASARTWTVSTTPVQVLTADPYRAVAVLVADTDVFVGHVQHGAGDDITSAWWPQGVPLVVTATVDVHVRCARSDQTARVSVRTERWATGSEHAAR
jgi:hypothetical protein